MSRSANEKENAETRAWAQEKTLQRLIERAVKGWALIIESGSDEKGLARIKVRSNHTTLAWVGSPAEWQDAMLKYHANIFATDIYKQTIRSTK